MKLDWLPKISSHSQSIWCPHCGEEFGIEEEIEAAEKRGIGVFLDYLINDISSIEDSLWLKKLQQMKSQLEAQDDRAISTY